MDQMQGPTEAVETWGANWEPVNAGGTPSAQKVRMMLESASAYKNAAGQAFSLAAGRIEEQILLDDGASELLHRIAANSNAEADAIKQIAADFDSVHEGRLSNMRSDDPRAGSWDWKGNQDGDMGPG